ncbi:MAG: membrane protein insertase YidC [Deltaproteobacteria bacterium]|jgi:YidC/Oxa1 family membrane protein insertase|nr:membrane protein insertase YidC [Deltaproteobacteria bacterium]
MDTRRLLIALALSLALLFAWQMFYSSMGWGPRREPAPASSPQTQSSTASVSAGVPFLQAEKDVPAAPGLEVTVETPLYTAVFSPVGGTLKSFALKQYQATDPLTLRPSGLPLQIIRAGDLPQGTLGLLLDKRPTWSSGGDGTAEWGYGGNGHILLEEGREEIVFNASLDGLKLRRVFSFSADTYVLREKLSVFSPVPRKVEIGHLLSTGRLSGPEEYNSATKIALLRDSGFTDESDLKSLAAWIPYGDRIRWAGSMGNYFLAAVIPEDPAFSLRAGYQNDLFSLLLERPEVSLGPEHTFESEFSYYFGPKRRVDLEAAPADFSQAMEYGWFGWIAAPLLGMLKWFYSFAHNWGVAIILLTVLIKILLWPLSYKSYKSMENMKKLQPLMLKIREKYKDDKTRQNQEVMQLYKTYKVNPMGGCLPIFVQLPVFFGLYRALLSSIELRQADFIEFLPFSDIVWLADLSLKDPLYITPIIMGLTMLLQQKMTPTSGDPTQAKIMMFLPVIFTFLFINFPSGLVIYWLFNNIISILQQYGQMKLSNRKKT